MSNSRARMIQSILFDVDGMIIRRHAYFSQYYAQTYGVDLARIEPFFSSAFPQCLIGKADLKQELGKRLADWEWVGTVDELLDRWFAYESDIDLRVLASVTKLRARGIACYIHTNNEQYRIKHMRDVLGLGKQFDGIFSSAFLGHKKPKHEFWNAIFESIQPTSKQDVLVWDDEALNVESAKEFGFLSEVYSDFDSYESRIQALVG